MVCIIGEGGSVSRTSFQAGIASARERVTAYLTGAGEKTTRDVTSEVFGLTDPQATAIVGDVLTAMVREGALSARLRDGARSIDTLVSIKKA